MDVSRVGAGRIAERARRDLRTEGNKPMTTYDPEHPDPQHEQPPVESTDDPADFEPGVGIEDDPGELPADIPDALPDEEG